MRLASWTLARAGTRRPRRGRAWRLVAPAPAVPLASRHRTPRRHRVRVHRVPRGHGRAVGRPRPRMGQSAGRRRDRTPQAVPARRRRGTRARHPGHAHHQRPRGGARRSSPSTVRSTRSTRRSSPPRRTGARPGCCGPSEVAMLDSVHLAPVIFQARVPAVADLRITVIGRAHVRDRDHQGPQRLPTRLSGRPRPGTASGRRLSPATWKPGCAGCSIASAWSTVPSTCSGRSTHDSSSSRSIPRASGASSRSAPGSR